MHHYNFVIIILYSQN